MYRERDKGIESAFILLPLVKLLLSVSLEFATKTPEIAAAAQMTKSPSLLVTRMTPI